MVDDMQVFYNRYEDRLKNNNMAEEDRSLLQETVQEVNANIAKNKQNIQLLALEIQKTND